MFAREARRCLNSLELENIVSIDAYAVFPIGLTHLFRSPFHPFTAAAAWRAQVSRRADRDADQSALRTIAPRTRHRAGSASGAHAMGGLPPRQSATPWVPWFFIQHYPVYEPFAFFFWWYWFDAYAPDVFAEASAFAAGGGIAGAALAIIGFGLAGTRAQARHDLRLGALGQRSRCQAAGLIGNEGVFLGRFRHHYLRHDGPEHVMCFAPTRSGKGVGLVIPTLLTWPRSAVIHDIKGENWELTAGWRARFSHCLLFDPTDLRSARLQPAARSASRAA